MTRPELPTVPDGPSIALGVDVSHYQRPSRINWERLAETHRFCIANACDGTKPDPAFEEHIRRARDAGLSVGAYLFFVPGQDAVSQYLTFCELAENVRLGPFDILPCLDLEDFGSKHIGPEHSDTAHLLARSLEGQFGGCIIYTARTYWERMGCPEWVADHPLWIAHYTNATHPVSLGAMHWRIWQHSVAPLPEIYEGDIDQNRARLPLPVIPDKDAERRRIEGLIALTADDVRRSNRP